MMISSVNTDNIQKTCATCLAPAVLLTSTLQYTYIKTIKLNANLCSRLLELYDLARDFFFLSFDHVLTYMSCETRAD